VTLLRQGLGFTILVFIKPNQLTMIGAQGI
jgi:hypothetical protein